MPLLTNYESNNNDGFHNNEYLHAQEGIVDAKFIKISIIILIFAGTLLALNSKTFYNKTNINVFFCSYFVISLFIVYHMLNSIAGNSNIHSTDGSGNTDIIVLLILILIPAGTFLMFRLKSFLHKTHICLFFGFYFGFTLVTLYHSLNTILFKEWSLTYYYEYLFLGILSGLVSSVIAILFSKKHKQNYIRSKEESKPEQELFKSRDITYKINDNYKVYSASGKE